MATTGRTVGGRSAVRRLAAARFASSGGSHAAQIALAFTVYEQTHSSLWVSASLVASAGVVGLVGPVSGRLSDRFDRRRVMVVAELAGALGWLLVLLADRPVTLVLFALVATAANAPFKAAASASVPNLVAGDDLTWANGTIATATNASLLVGPLVGGALVGAVGPRAVYAINVVSFVIAAWMISRLRGTFATVRPDRAAGTQGHNRWRRIAADRPRRRLFVVTALTFAAFGITLVADLPLVDHLGGGATGYALLTTLWGAGAIVGSTVAGRVRARHELRALTVGSVAMALSIGSLALVPNLPLAIAVGTIGGLGSGIAFTPWYSLMQRTTPDAERGTAFAMAETFEQTAFVGGMVAAGGLISVLGVQPTYLVAGLLLAAAATTAHRVVPSPATIPVDTPLITPA
jgi:MFS family permease